MGSQFPDQGSNPRPRHCKADSLPMDYQGSPQYNVLKTVFVRWRSSDYGFLSSAKPLPDYPRGRWGTYGGSVRAERTHHRHPSRSSTQGGLGSDFHEPERCWLWSEGIHGELMPEYIPTGCVSRKITGHPEETTLKAPKMG